MALSTSTQDFIACIAALEGNEFEAAVIGHLSRAFTDFQSVPRVHGDGGLDGLSDGGSVGHCCYGPEGAKAAKALDKLLRKKIVDKFRGDLRKLFEVRPKGRTSLVHADNPGLSAVLGTRKLKLIRLHLNRFDDKSLIGLLHKEFSDCLRSSNCKFVDAKCKLTIWGPKELCTHVPASEETLFRLRDPILAKVLESTAGTMAAPAHGDLGMFDDKFDDLDARFQRPGVVAKVRANMRKSWEAVLAFDQELAVSAPSLHAEFDRTRRLAANNAQRRQLTPGAIDANAEMDAARESFASALEQRIGAGVDELRRDEIATGEVARLIGDCAIDWRETP